MPTHGRKPARLNPDEAFAKALQRARKRRGLSQEALGFQSGYHRTYISLLERGKMNPSLRTILSLSAALGMPAAALGSHDNLLRPGPHIGRHLRVDLSGAYVIDECCLPADRHFGSVKHCRGGESGEGFGFGVMTRQ